MPADLQQPTRKNQTFVQALKRYQRAGGSAAAPIAQITTAEEEAQETLFDSAHVINNIDHQEPALAILTGRA